MSKVSDIIINTFLEDCDKIGEMPWQRPYKVFNSINYITRKQYKGFNSLILPSGEYLTMNQLISLNKKLGTNYRVKKDSKWWQIVYYVLNDYAVSEKSFYEELGDKTSYFDFISKELVTKAGNYTYYVEKGIVRKKRNAMRYYNVTNIHNCCDDTGKPLQTKCVDYISKDIQREDILELIQDYNKRTGVPIDWTGVGVPYYDSATDTICLNRNVVSEDALIAVLFHELAHSSGAFNRLNRDVIARISSDKNLIAKEECIAEIASSMLCAKFGIHDFCIDKRVYANSVVYVNHYKKKIKEWGSEFMYVVTEAERACNYILGIS